MLVEVDDLVVEIGSKRVVDDLSFAVAAGETFGFLGSNGSGKTTTLRCLLGMMRPTSGTLLIEGEPFVQRGATRVGYLPEERGIYRKERVLDVMTYFGEIKGLSRSSARRWSTSYLERVGLDRSRNVRLDKLSGGQQQKIQLGIAIMNEPNLLILDEPAKGLDPVNRQLLMDLIAECRDRGAGVILVTHHMDEVERLCDRALLLRDGVARAYGTIPEIQSRFGERRIRVRTAGTLAASRLFAIASRSGDVYDLEPGRDVSDERVFDELTRGGSRLSSFEPRSTSMDEVFIRVYGESAAA